MKKTIILLFAVLIYGASFSQASYRVYAIRTNNDLTKDTFLRKDFTDSVFTKSFVYVQRTKEYYDQFYDPVYPNSFEKYVMAANNIWQNIPDYTASGSYTPTLFNTTNIAASGAYECGWLRVGNRVTVYGLVDIDVTNAANSELRMSLPIATNITQASDLAGTAASNAAAGLTAPIAGNVATDRAAFIFMASSLTNNTYAFTFSYTIK